MQCCIISSSCFALHAKGWKYKLGNYINKDFPSRSKWCITIASGTQHRDTWTEPCPSTEHGAFVVSYVVHCFWSRRHHHYCDKYRRLSCVLFEQITVKKATQPVLGRFGHLRHYGWDHRDAIVHISTDILVAKRTPNCDKRFIRGLQSNGHSLRLCLYLHLGDDCCWSGLRNSVSILPPSPSKRSLSVHDSLRVGTFRIIGIVLLSVQGGHSAKRGLCLSFATKHLRVSSGYLHILSTGLDSSKVFQNISRHKRGAISGKALGGTLIHDNCRFYLHLVTISRFELYLPFLQITQLSSVVRLGCLC